MPPTTQGVAYVVFRGRKPGVYRSRDECETQVNEFSKAKFKSFESFAEASLVWKDWQRKCAGILAASTTLRAPENTARPWAESINTPTSWIEPSSPQQIHKASNLADAAQAQSLQHVEPPSLGLPEPLYPELPPDHQVYPTAAEYTWNSNIQIRPVLQQNPHLAGIPSETIQGYPSSYISPVFNDPPQYISPSQCLSKAKQLAKGAISQSSLQSPPHTSPTHLYPVLPSVDRPSAFRAPIAFIDLTEDSPPPSPHVPERPTSFKRPPRNTHRTDEKATKKLKLEAAVQKPNFKGDANIYAPDDEVVVKQITNKALWDVPEYPRTLTESAHLALSEVPALTVEERYELDQLNKYPAISRAPEKKIELSPEQEKVVNLALRKANIFLTGAAGCGKTVTLKEILYRLGKKKKGGNVQVVAPTGIAALPLGGKTTYSFAGWNPDSFRKGIHKLLEKPKIGVIKAINDLDVLVIEEISMVENQFLERMNLLFQKVLMNKLPFGGKQVIFLGDFHQLPPVKPFEYCLQCGAPIPERQDPICISKDCKDSEDQILFKRNDKWAFRAPVWRELKLRHVRLEQIHRQKDTRFQDILNKIRNGTDLTADEWHDLERPKELPKNAFAVRLMSRLAQVKRFNEQKLNDLRSQPKAWRVADHCMKLTATRGGQPDPPDPQKIHEYKESLRDHRFLPDLTLKVGARVVLLYNLNHDLGLVNGSQGVICGFKRAEDELETIMEQSGDHPEIRMESMHAYHESGNPEWRPLVRFTNGKIVQIPAVASASLRGGSHTHEQYVVCRTQIPLTLAWALSIHKSQGMTLEYVEVLSQDIFESGQLYVALSRATHMNGLRLTGFSRKQLPMDKDVLDFYTTTKWEKFRSKD